MSIARLRRTMLLFLVLGATIQIACKSDEGSRQDVPKAIVDTNVPPPEPSETSSDVRVEALASLEKVYVPMKAASLQSLDDALADNGYGNVKASDFKPQFETVDTENGVAIVAYSAADWIAPSTMFQPMTVTQWLEASLSHQGADGAILNPGHPGQTLALTDAEIVEALEWLPPRQALPMEIYVSR